MSGRERIERLREAVPLQRVLADYGYQVDPSYDGEQQFSCDLHGDGVDSKPSARLYPHTQSAYCFSCDRSRDIIQFTREKEGLEFWKAVTFLERRYGLPVYEYQYEPKGPSLREQISDITSKIPVYSDIQERLLAKITRELRDRSDANQTLDAELLRFIELYDKVCYTVKQGKVTEETGAAALTKLFTQWVEYYGA